METGLKTKVVNMTSSRGNDVLNQFRIETNKGVLFQSYNSMIVFRKYTKDKFGNRRIKIYLDEHYWDYSNTTGKYRNDFLGETKRETEKKIKSGEYVLTNLN